jgi:hypothetical protein
VTKLSRHQLPIQRLLSTRGFVGALVIISAAALVACSGPSDGTATSATPGTLGTAASAAPATASATLVPLPALGVELPASEIPWNQVGPGWILATWSPAPGMTSPLRLYLLDPAGGRYAITTLAAEFNGLPGDSGQTPTLVDWSGDGRRALFENTGFKTETITEVDLATGAKQTFTVAGARIGTPEEGAYSRPTGQAIFLSTGDEGSDPKAPLERVDLSGAKQLTFPTDLGAAGKFSGRYLASPDGTQLVLGAANGLAVVDNDGVVSRQLPMPVPLTGCSPVRWWTSTVILAFCGDTSHSTGVQCGTTSRSPGSQLWQVPLDGGAPTALTALNTGQRDDPRFGQDLSDTDAWQLPSGTYLHSDGACGSMFLSRLTPDKHTTPVTVPGISDGFVLVTGATADKLVLQASLRSGGAGLLTYDPAANTSTVLLGPTVNGGRVQDAILYRTP